MLRGDRVDDDSVGEALGEVRAMLEKSTTREETEAVGFDAVLAAGCEVCLGSLEQVELLFAAAAAAAAAFLERS